MKIRIMQVNEVHNSAACKISHMQAGEGWYFMLDQNTYIYAYFRELRVLTHALLLRGDSRQWIKQHTLLLREWVILIFLFRSAFARYCTVFQSSIRIAACEEACHSELCCLLPVFVYDGRATEGSFVSRQRNLLITDLKKRFVAAGS